MADPATILATWFTPSSLFIFVNLVIGTIALASRFNNNAPNNLNQNQNQQQQPQLNRSTSILNRVSSFNLRQYYNNNNQNEQTNTTQHESDSESTQPQPQLVRKPSLLQRVISFNLYKHQPQHSQIHFAQPEPENRSHETDPSQDPNMSSESGDEVKSKVEKEMKKSASERELPVKMEWDEEEDEETVEQRRPATAAARSETTADKEDEEVDAKADDFIIRFKKQLKLQRLDSFLRYRDTMRGT